jgi:hypothetical protein
VETTNASFQLNTGANLNFAWLWTDKMTARAGASYVNANYEIIVAGQQNRIDNTLNGSLSLSYSPVRMATIDLGLQTGRQNSTLPLNDYTFHTVFVSVKADF